MTESSEGPVPEGKYVSANGLEIYFREWGRGRPLVLLHGATDTHAYWSPFIPAFSEKYRVITPDNRGHGRTVNPGPTLTYPMMADDLAEFVRAMNLESPIIFGFSDGGQAALDLGIRYPNLPGALVLGGVWFRFTRFYQEAISSFGFISPGIMDFEVYKKYAPRDWADRIKKAHHDPRPEYPAILLSALAKLWWTPIEYTDEDLLKISSPVLVLTGEEDEFIPVEEAQQLSNKISGAELAVLPGARHNDVIVTRGVFLNIVLEFLNRRA